VLFHGASILVPVLGLLVQIFFNSDKNKLYMQVMIAHEVFTALMSLIVIYTFYSKNRQMLIDRQVEPHIVQEKIKEPKRDAKEKKIEIEKDDLFDQTKPANQSSTVL
jgi:hypothetical protein